MKILLTIPSPPLPDTDLAQCDIDNIPEHPLHLKCRTEYNLTYFRPEGQELL